MAGRPLKFLHDIPPQTRDMKEEKARWVKLTNFNSWQILKLLSSGPMWVRQLLGKCAGSTQTFEWYITQLLELGLIAESKAKTWPWRRTLSLTPKGEKVVELFSQIGEIVAEKRKTAEVGRELIETVSRR